MPLLILHCRTRLFLVFIQQRTTLGGTPTLTVPGRDNEFHTDSPPNFSVTNFYIPDKYLSMGEMTRCVFFLRIY